jgi:hypothetical protein
MNPNRLYLIAALSPVLALAAAGQTPPPAPPPPPANVSAPQPPLPMAQIQGGVSATHSSRVSAAVYGPQGELQAVTLRDGVAVTLPPDLGMRLQSNVIRGTRVQVSGIQRVIAGQTSLVASAPFTDAGPGLAGGTLPPPPPAGPPDPRGPAGRGPGAPPPPPGGSAPPPPPAGTPPPPPPQM